MLRQTFLAALTASLLLSGCSNSDTRDTDTAQPVGSDRDEHGCIASAGYTWCAKTDKCERSWELAEQVGLPDSPEAFTEYCNN